jgi:hypothetical protein
MVVLMDMALHHGTRGKIPAAINSRKPAAMTTAHVSREKRGAREGTTAVWSPMSVLLVPKTGASK